jgi:hypothetical protein
MHIFINYNQDVIRNISVTTYLYLEKFSCNPLKITEISVKPLASSKMSHEEITHNSIAIVTLA